MTAIIDHNDTLCGIEAVMHDTGSLTLDLYKSPTDKTTVDLTQHEVTIKDGTGVEVVYNANIR